jgi:hypothetical protein
LLGGWKALGVYISDTFGAGQLKKCNQFPEYKEQVSKSCNLLVDLREHNNFPCPHLTKCTTNLTTKISRGCWQSYISPFLIHSMKTPFQRAQNLSSRSNVTVKIASTGIPDFKIQLHYSITNNHFPYVSE